MGYVVVDHTHEPEAGLYRIVIGWEELVEQPEYDENGDPVMDDSDPPTHRMTVVPVLSNVADYVFAEDDPAWAGMRDDLAAKVQLQRVVEAIVASEQAEPQPEPETRQMPGIGAPLQF